MADEREDSRWEEQVHKLENINKILQARNAQLEELLRNRDDVQTAVRKLIASKDFLRRAHDLYEDVKGTAYFEQTGQLPDAPMANMYADAAAESAQEFSEFRRIRTLENVCNLYADKPHTGKPFTPDMVSEDPVHRERSVKALLRAADHLTGSNHQDAGERPVDRSVGVTTYDEVQQDMSDEGLEALKNIIGSDFGTRSYLYGPVITNQAGEVVETAREGDRLFVRNPDGTSTEIGTVAPFVDDDPDNLMTPENLAKHCLSGEASARIVGMGEKGKSDDVQE